MTDSEIRAAIAEKCGLTAYDERPDYGFDKKGVACSIPDYPNDLNAMHEAENYLSGEAWAKYFEWLQHNGKATGVRATARERAEAFCRTIGHQT